MKPVIDVILAMEKGLFKSLIPFNIMFFAHGKNVCLVNVYKKVNIVAKYTLFCILLSSILLLYLVFVEDPNTFDFLWFGWMDPWKNP
jgi:hypothetical protein